MDKIEISLVIPAYNEEAKIEKDIREAIIFFKKEKIKAEIIVSTDGVTDRTNQIVKNLEKEFPNLRLIAKKEKIGKGAALKRGVKQASGDIIMFADAGYCVPYEFVKDGIKVLHEGNDVALASRIKKASKIVKPQPLYRKLGSRVFGVLVRTVLGIPKSIKDTQCGFKLYKNTVAKNLFEKMQTNGFMFDIELILLAKKLGYKQKQFSVSWSNDSDTKFQASTGSFKILKELFFIKFVYKV